MVRGAPEETVKEVRSISYVQHAACCRRIYTRLHVVISNTPLLLFSNLGILWISLCERVQSLNRNKPMNWFVATLLNQEPPLTTINHHLATISPLHNHSIASSQYSVVSSKFLMVSWGFRLSPTKLSLGDVEMAPTNHPSYGLIYPTTRGTNFRIQSKESNPIQRIQRNPQSNPNRNFPFAQQPGQRKPESNPKPRASSAPSAELRQRRNRTPHVSRARCSDTRPGRRRRSRRRRCTRRRMRSTGVLETKTQSRSKRIDLLTFWFSNFGPYL